MEQCKACGVCEDVCPDSAVHVEGETYKTPFNLDDMPVSFTTYDLDFVRRKHLGF